ncbi:MAG TPA: hypothetical protein VGX97_09300 [bacterium]|nr:hypothetical protein [bacterium]
MWPELFGAGSELGLLIAGSAVAGLGAILWYAIRTPRPLGPDPAADLWRRYEQGDVTSWEAARLFRILAAQQVAAEQATRRLARTWRTEAEGTGWGITPAWGMEPADAGRPDYPARAR